MTLNRTVALVGMMGAGKTSVGRRLAARLEVPFRDADHEIEAAAGLTVAEIFERFGEPDFRDGERKVIARLLDEPPHVLATGGGAFMDDATRAAMKRRGLHHLAEGAGGIAVVAGQKARDQAAAEQRRPARDPGAAAGHARTGLCQGRHDAGKRRRAAWRGGGADCRRLCGRTRTVRGRMSDVT